MSYNAEKPIESINPPIFNFIFKKEHENVWGDEE